jgi:hypothetical protein
MIRRFVYHLFWNFYDYLGTYLFIGAAFSLTILLVITSVAPELVGLPSTALRIALLMVAVLVVILLVSAAMAGFMPFALHAARDKTPRLPDLYAFIRRHLPRYAALTALVSVVALLVSANIYFYFRLSIVGKGVLSLIGTAAGAAFFWAGLAVAAYLAIVLVAASESETWRALARRAFMAMALTPGLWFFAMLTLVAGSALALLSRVGIVFIFPWFATVVATAYRIVEQHADYLAEARNELGPDHPVSVYKRKAIELAWNWEYRQPRRTLRELIKPWEY